MIKYFVCGTILEKDHVEAIINCTNISQLELLSNSRCLATMRLARKRKQIVEQIVEQAKRNKKQTIIPTPNPRRINYETKSTTNDPYWETIEVEEQNVTSEV